MGSLGRSVSIIGVGYTPLGDVRETPEILNCSEKELYSMAGLEAMQDAGIEAKNIDAYIVGLVGAGYYAHTTAASPGFAEWIGLRNKPTFFHDEGCASANIGLQQAVMMVASGAYDCVLSGGVNIVNSTPKAGYVPFIRDAMPMHEFWDVVNSGNETVYEKPGGQIGSQCDAQAVSYCRRNGLTIGQMNDAMVQYMLGQRQQALLNPKAAIVKESYEDEAKKFGVNDPKEFLLSDQFNPKSGTVLRARFGGAFVDGASAIIVCATDKVASITKQQAIEVAGIGSATSMNRAVTEYPWKADVAAFKDAYSMAGIVDPHKEIDYLSVHDCPIASIFHTGEASGYFKEGESWKYMMEGELTFKGSRPINTSGGRTQLGHPVAAATGVEIAEAVNQMRGTNGKRQMANPPRLSVINGAGLGVSVSVTVLKTL